MHSQTYCCPTYYNFLGMWKTEIRLQLVIGILLCEVKQNDCYFARNLPLESIRIMIVQILQNQIYSYYTRT